MPELYTLYVFPKAARMTAVEGLTHTQTQIVIKALPADCSVMVFNQSEKRMVFNLFADNLSNILDKVAII